MDVYSGYCLADFLNSRSARFRAKVLDYGTGCWVLVADTLAPDGHGQPTSLEPVVEFDHRFLRRVRLREDRFPREYVRLLESWRDESGVTQQASSIEG